MSDHGLPSANGRLKTKVAAVLRRAPFLLEVAARLWRVHIPRFTAGVAGVIVNEAGAILLVEHVFHVEYPWGLPGGWVGRREDPRDALVRELMEELRLPVGINRLLFAAADPERNHLDFAYRGRPEGEIRRLSSEILEFGWFDPAELPRLSTFHQLAVEAAFPELAGEARHGIR
ncbi:MAG: NUDIX hydrolase [Anaerolineae bacterium]|nr:NUDIX hydrolase [Anaerolineae bacterium]